MANPLISFSRDQETKKLVVRVRAGRRIVERFNGAGDLIHSGIEAVDRATGGLVDAVSGGRVSSPCPGCEERQQGANNRIQFVE
jgi:hypothetical protein